MTLRDLTLARHDTSTTREVLNTFVRAQAKAFLSIPVSSPLHRQTLEVTHGLLSTNPRVVMHALRHPHLGALLATGEIAELCLLLLFELALAGALPERGVSVGSPEWPALRHQRANLLVTPAPSVRVLRFLPGRVLFDDSPFEPHAQGPWRLERPFHDVVDGVSLALSDNNPLSSFEAHPDKRGNAIDLGGRDIDEWLSALRGSVALVDEHLPLLGEELRLILRLIVPVGWHEERHLSASYREAVGTIYLSLHPNPMTMAEALVHELQHNKLNAVLSFDPLLHNAFSPLYSSPVRPDPRPLHGVVLAVHAFQAVAALYESMAAKRHPLSTNESWRQRFRDVIRMTRTGARTVLQHAKPTSTGRDLLEEMHALDRHFARYEATHWPHPQEGPEPSLPE